MAKSKPVATKSLTEDVVSKRVCDLGAFINYLEKTTPESWAVDAFIGCCTTGNRHEVCSHVKAYIRRQQLALISRLEEKAIEGYPILKSTGKFRAIPISALTAIRQELEGMEDLDS